MLTNVLCKMCVEKKKVDKTTRNHFTGKFTVFMCNQVLTTTVEVSCRAFRDSGMAGVSGLDDGLLSLLVVALPLL